MNTTLRLFCFTPFLLLLVQGARAATLMVTNSADSGAGTLRNLVASANPGDTIIFNNTLSGRTIALTSGQITLSNNVTIDGSALASPVQLNGNGSNRIFSTTSGANANLTFLVITNGYDTSGSAGGGILNGAGCTLTVSNCSFAGNKAISAAGGGALHNNGFLSLNNSTLAGNMATYGGAVGNTAGATTVANNCTFSLNSASTSGGAIILGGGVLVLNSSTVASNSAVSSGGGIYNSGTVLLTNSIVSANAAGASTNLYGGYSGSSNLVNIAKIGLAPLGNYGGPTKTMPPLPGSPAIDAGNDPAASQFATDQRGFARIAGAHVDIGAAEAGNAIPGYTYGNVVNTNSDVLDGSNTNVLSLRTAIFFATNNATITFATNLSGAIILLTNGQITLATNLTIDGSALASAVQLNGNNASRIFYITNASVTLKALIITNGYASGAGGAILNSGTLNLIQSTLAGNSSSNGGGAIASLGTTANLTMTNCTVVNNSAEFAGGIWSQGPVMTLTFCTITANTGTGGAGGLVAEIGTDTLLNTIAANNSGTLDPDIGGSSATLVLSGTNLIGQPAAYYSNTSSGLPNGNGQLVGSAASPLNPLLAPLGNYGGPTPTMPPQPGSLAIDAGAVTTLTTDQRGFARTVGAAADIGAVESGNAIPGYNYTVVTVTNDFLSEWTNNGVTLRSATAFAPANATITFATNLSGQTIRLTNGQITLSQNVTIDGSALARAIQLNGNGSHRIFYVNSGVTNTLNTLIITNGYDGTGAGGGGIYNGGGLVVNNCTIANNVTTYLGGGIINYFGTLAVNNSTLANNSGTGGGIDNNGGTLSLNNSTLANNSANNLGGGINNFGIMNMTNSIVCSNTASSGPNVYGLSYSGANNLVDTNALLALLGNYGGPTLTMPPLPGSPAIDAGTATTLTTDQRGFARVVGAAVDIGAVESGNYIPTLNYTVVSLTNDVLNDGLGGVSLRTAVAYAPTNATITFATNLSGQTILLTNSTIVLNKGVTIDATSLSKGVSIDGNHIGSVFYATGGTNVLTALTITNGYGLNGIGGGGVYNTATLTLNNCKLTGNATTNSGGGIYNLGAITLNLCTFTGNQATNNGGAVYTTGGTAWINQCTFATNATSTNVFSGGGAIAAASASSLVLLNSTFAGNTAWEGGAVGAYYTAAAITNCTFSGNTGTHLGGALGLDYNPQTTLNQLTVISNTSSAGVGGGGILLYQTTNVTLINSIVAGNTAPGAPSMAQDINNYFNPLTLQGANLINGLTNYLGATTIGTYLNAAPQVAPLGNYGGPTQTMPPLPGSPAIDAGSDAAASGLATDQRGFARIAGAHVDIGAVEFGNAVAGFTYGNVVNTNSDVLDGSNTNFLSLRTAVFLATNNATITFATNLSGATILLTNASGALLLNKSFNIDASALTNGLAINGNHTGNNGVFDSITGITNVLTALTITNGAASASAGGGGIVSRGNLTLNRCTLAGNSAGYGGGIYNEGALTVNQCTLAGNSASYFGGGIENHGTLTVNQSTLAGNSASYGGGIFNFASTVAINCIIANNTATGGFGPDYSDDDRGYDFLGNGQSLNFGGVNLVSTAPAVDGSQTGTYIFAAPNLAPLGNYGGPTQTMPPLPGSRAIDGCTNGAPAFATDQRGFPRIVGAFADIGAVEAGNFIPGYNYNLVTITNDYLNDGVGGVTLRTAVAFASNNPAITFATNLSGQTILLTNGSILLNRSLNIDASALAAGIMINGNQTSTNSVFDSVPGITNVLTALTITNGSAANGGGIISRGNLTLNQCTLAGNFAVRGGGIFNDAGVLAVNSSLLASNICSGAKGSFGGGLYNHGGTVTVNNSTLVNNRANQGGGIYNSNSSSMTLNQCTVVQNSFYDIYKLSGGTLNLTNSIVSVLSAPGNGNNNLLDRNNLNLAPLGNYGGRTLTMPPLLGSPAIDAGSDSVTNFLATDQRGLARLIGAHVDIGAVESGNAIPGFTPMVTTTDDVVDGDLVFAVSLREAVAFATNNATITFASNLAGQTISVTSGEFLLSQNFKIDAGGLSSPVILNANATSRLFEVVPGVTNVLSGLTILNGSAPGGTYPFDSGGGILNRGSLLVSNCTLLGNASAGDASAGGGGIENYQGNLTVANSTIASNTTAMVGGGIESYEAGLTVNQSTIVGNQVSGGDGAGGGIYSDTTLLAVNQATLTGNYADNGGGIYADGSATLFNSIVAANGGLAGTNLYGPITFQGTNLTAGNPLLGNLANYGGPTPTMPPKPGSPAFDAGAPTPFTTDQRGFPRVFNAGPDLGAVEFNMPAVRFTKSTRPNNGRLGLNFTSVSGIPFSVWAITNLMVAPGGWSNLGPAIETPSGSGQYQFVDPGSDQFPYRFYRLSSP